LYQQRLRVGGSVFLEAEEDGDAHLRAQAGAEAPLGECSPGGSVEKGDGAAPLDLDGTDRAVIGDEGDEDDLSLLAPSSCRDGIGRFDPLEDITDQSRHDLFRGGDGRGRRGDLDGKGSRLGSHLWGRASFRGRSNCRNLRLRDRGLLPLLAGRGLRLRHRLQFRLWFRFRNRLRLGNRFRLRFGNRLRLRKGLLFDDGRINRLFFRHRLQEVAADRFGRGLLRQRKRGQADRHGLR
jgi:hypothetical protein